MDLDIALTMRHDYKHLDGLLEGVGEKGLVDLTLAAVTINAWNRLASLFVLRRAAIGRI